MKTTKQRAVIEALVKTVSREKGCTVMDVPFRDLVVLGKGVNRVLQIGNSKPYAALSASRLNNTPEENKKRSQQLLSEIKSLGLFAYDLVGMYRECPDDNQDCDDDEKKQVVEDSFFVPWRENLFTLQEFGEAMLALSQKYNQDSFLFGLPPKWNYDEENVTVAGNTLEVGQHYFVYGTGGFDSVGNRLALETLTEYGSIAIDPKKNRIMEFVIKGTLQPGTVSGCRRFSNAGLLWLPTNSKPSNERTYKILKAKGKL